MRSPAWNEHVVPGIQVVHLAVNPDPEASLDNVKGFVAAIVPMKTSNPSALTTFQQGECAFRLLS
jgi:hypothetical protein